MGVLKLTRWEESFTMYIHIYQTMCSPWGCRESDTTERLGTAQHAVNVLQFYLSTVPRTQLKRKNESTSQCAQLLSYHTALVFMIST